MLLPILDPLNRLSKSHGTLEPGCGLVSDVIALSVAILCCLGVACHFPDYLTTPPLRQSYDVAVVRQLLDWSLVVASGIALFNRAFGRVRWLSAGAFVLIALSLALGGHGVEVAPNFPDHTPYIGLDGLILDLLGASLLFVFVEKLFALRRDKPVFHWHHAQDGEALDRESAARCAFIDHLFGTAVQSHRAWRTRYGVLGACVPNGFFEPLAFPFTRNNQPSDVA